MMIMWLGKNTVCSIGKKELKEIMDQWTVRHNITELMLKQC